MAIAYIIFLIVTVCVSTVLSGHDVDGLLYDLTYPMNNVTISWSGKPFILNVTKRVVKEPDYSFNAQSDEIITPTHTGTHLDAPCHFAEGQWCVSDIPIERLFSRPGYIIDISSKCATNNDCVLTDQDLELWLQEVGKIDDGAVILVKTGWSKHWPDRPKYFGYDDKNEKHFPGIAKSAAIFLTSKEGLNVYGVGIEGPSVDSGFNKDRQTHIILGQKNIYNLENVPSLHQLPSKGFYITSLPIKIDQSSGSPVRLVARRVFNSAVGHGSGLFYIILIMLCGRYKAINMSKL